MKFILNKKETTPSHFKCAKLINKTSFLRLKIKFNTIFAYIHTPRRLFFKSI